MKTHIKSFAFLFALFIAQFAMAQSSDPVLFKVSGKPVHVSEFDYIYKKTNGAQATYSRESLEEYLDLYVKFKLKVQRARDMELDTITSLSRELEGYRRQLADSYLVDKEVTEKLVMEVYERMKTEREVAHILFKFKNASTSEDSAAVIDKASRVLEMLKKGGDFERMAIGQSDDPNVMNTKGNLGFITAMLPNGFYELENAVYKTPVGKVSDLVYSPMGLHIIKVLQERPERGEVEVSHILIKDPENGPVPDAEKKIREAYKELKSGKTFEEVAAKFSEDKVTSNKGGYLGFFGINRYEQSFEDAAFGITEDQTYSEPFKTKLGWHIVKRISRKGLEPLQKIKGRLQVQVAQDGRYEAAKMRMIDQVKIESGFNEKPDVLEKYLQQLDLEFLTYKWKPDTREQREKLFELSDGNVATTGDFSEFLLRNQRKRLQMARDSNVRETAKILYQDFVAENMIKFAERKLETKYPEFKALMREYEEGILLFEATKMKVWDKASQDTVGLINFHNSNRTKYMHEERALINHYDIFIQDPKKANKAYLYALKNSPAKTIKKYNKKGETVKITSVEAETGETDKMAGLEWRAGASTSMIYNDVKAAYSFSKVEEILAPRPKSLNEARGYIIADYQDYLEKKWVEELRSSYDVKIDKDVLSKMIR